jgi:hypothetical protein
MPLCGHAKKRQEGGWPARILFPNSIPAPFRSSAARRRPPERSRQPSFPPARAPRPGAPCNAPGQHGPPGGAKLPLARPSGRGAPLGRGARPGSLRAPGSSSLRSPGSRSTSTAGRPEFRALVPCPEPGGGSAGPRSGPTPPLWRSPRFGGKFSGMAGSVRDPRGARPAPGRPITRIWS